MKIFDSPRVLIIAAFVGAAFAWADGYAVEDDRPASHIWITVDSEEPGVEFAVISSEAPTRNQVPYVTPRTFMLETPEMSAVVVPVQVGESLNIRVVQSFPDGHVQLHSGVAHYHSYHFGPGGLSVGYPGPGQLEATLDRKGMDRTTVHFGGPLGCTEADVFDLVRRERFAEARARCEGSSQAEG